MVHFSTHSQRFHVVKFSALCPALENTAVYRLIPWKCKISLPSNWILTSQGRALLHRVK